MHGDEIKVFICEDSELIRTGIACALERAGGFKIVGSASDGLIAIETVGGLQPDVVLMDVRMPHVDGIEATRQIKQVHPEIKVIMLTASDDEQTTLAALASGADGYCLKQSPLQNITQALSATASGACWLDPGVAMRVLRHCAREGTASAQSIARRGDQDTRFRLSVREMEVLHHLVEGLSNKQIADTLCLSAETVKTHIRHIMEKLQVGDRTQAAVRALREGLVKNEPEKNEQTRSSYFSPPPLENLA